MGGRFIEKVREEIKRHLSEIFEFEVRDPRLSLITVMDVRLSKDLRRATVYVSATGDENSEDEALAVLGEQRGFLRSALAKRLRLRHTPELRFEAYPLERYARRIREILGEE